MPRRSKHDVETEISALVEEYVVASKSIPPPADMADTEARVLLALAKKLESLDRSRHNLAQQLGSTIRDSGTFEQIGQDQLDNLMLRSEVTRLTSELTRANTELAELKEERKLWANRKHDWTLRVLFAAIAAGAAYIWSQITSKK